MSTRRLERYERKFSKDEVIFEEGSYGEEVFLIKSGEVQILKESNGSERVLATLGSGEIIGESGFKDERHSRHATVKTITEVVGWKLPSDDFRSLVDQEESFRNKLINSLITRLNDTTEKLIHSLSKDSLFLEVSSLLLPLLDAEEWDSDEGTKTMDIDHSPEFLAYKFGSSLEVMEKYITHLNDSELERVEPEDREKLFELGGRIIEQGLKRIRSEYEVEESYDSDLLEALRTASDHVEKLEDEEEDLDKSDLQDMLKDRKQLQKVLNRCQEKDREDYSTQLLEKLTNVINREVNRRYNRETSKPGSRSLNKS